MWKKLEIEITINARRICKDSEIKCLGEYQDLYLKNHTLLLADVFENILEKCA